MYVTCSLYSAERFWIFLFILSYNKTEVDYIFFPDVNTCTFLLVTPSVTWGHCPARRPHSRLKTNEHGWTRHQLHGAGTVSSQAFFTLVSSSWHAEKSSSNVSQKTTWPCQKVGVCPERSSLPKANQAGGNHRSIRLLKSSWKPAIKVTVQIERNPPLLELWAAQAFLFRPILQPLESWTVGGGVGLNCGGWGSVSNLFCFLNA